MCIFYLFYINANLKFPHTCTRLAAGPAAVREAVAKEKKDRVVYRTVKIDLREVARLSSDQLEFVRALIYIN